MKVYCFNVNGYEIKATYSNEFLLRLNSLIQHWIELSNQFDQRMVIFLAAAPGAGKSTLACLIEHLSNGRIQALGMDGFHHYQSYILSHKVCINGEDVDMVSVKGCPESFDFDRFESFIKNVKNRNLWWPSYNRVKHDVEDDKIFVDKKIVLIEGNYLLLNESPWNRLKDYCDVSIYIELNEEDVKDRLIFRKMKGGFTKHVADFFYMNSDGKNVRRVIKNHLVSDIVIQYDGNKYCFKGY